jgi:hypothetical protein
MPLRNVTGGIGSATDVCSVGEANSGKPEFELEQIGTESGGSAAVSD